MTKTIPCTLTTISGHRARVSTPEQDHYILEITPSQGKPFVMDWYEPTYKGERKGGTTSRDSQYTQIEQEVLDAFWPLLG